MEIIPTPFRGRPRRLRTLIATLAVVVSVVASGATPARAATTYYTALSGSDTNPGSFASPFRTVAKGLRALFAGDTLIVRGGTYVERITSVVYRSGNAGNPIRVAAYPGEKPVIKGVLQIRDANYWTFDGINVLWDAASIEDPAVKIMHGVNWSFINGEVWGAKSYAGIFVGSGEVGEPSNWRIAGNCIHDTYAAHPPFLDHNLYIGLKAEDQPGPGVVERNILFNATNGENIKVGGGSEGGAEDVIVRNNTLYNASQNAMIVGATARTTFERNIMGKSIGKWWYPNLRGQDVTGAGNIARDNAGYGAAKFLSSTNSPKPIVDMGGNQFPLDPKFTPASCTGFRPQNPAAKMFGRWAPSGDPIGADWNDDQVETPGFVRGNVWYLNDGFDDDPEHVFAYGSSTDRKVVGDWDGDGVATPGIVRGNVWYLNDNFDPYADRIFQYGLATDKPVVGDWDADGTDTPGIVRGNTWYLNNGFGPNASKVFGFGLSTDVPVAGDWDDDAIDTPGIVRGSVWYLNNGFGPNAAITFGFGSSTDLPLVGDWDGDGVATVGVVRVSDWLLRNSNAAGSPDVVFSDEAWL
ncbi:MAG: right-handed parallel beta-helix repeat-containing protein [Actinomycetota bacterium]